MPIRVERAKRNRSDKYDYDYRSDGVPAGCAHDVSDNGGTLGTPAVDTDAYKKVFIGSGHVLEGNDKVYQNYFGDSEDYLGDVNQYKLETGFDFDAGVINNLQHDRAFKYAVDYPDAHHGPPIYGTQTKTALEDMAGTSETIYKQGINTGEESGTVKEVTDEDSFEAYIAEGGGDSGGPYWVEKSDYSLISGIHVGSADDPWSVATIMEAIENKFSVSV